MLFFKRKLKKSVPVDIIPKKNPLIDTGVSPEYFSLSSSADSDILALLDELNDFKYIGRLLSYLGQIGHSRKYRHSQERYYTKKEIEAAHRLVLASLFLKLPMQSQIEMKVYYHQNYAGLKEIMNHKSPILPGNPPPLWNTATLGYVDYLSTIQFDVNLSVLKLIARRNCRAQRVNFTPESCNELVKTVHARRLEDMKTSS